MTTELARCADCGQVMLQAHGCTRPFLRTAAGQRYQRIRHGDTREKWEDYGIPVPQRCGDCGCEPGALHHAHCDIEVCPVCAGQLLGCDGMGYHVGLPGVSLFHPGPPHGGLRRMR